MTVVASTAVSAMAIVGFHARERAGAGNDVQTIRHSETLRALDSAVFRVPEKGWQVQIEEDFSKMTEGTPEEPDSIQLVTAQDYSVPSDYIGSEGWTAYGIYQAGGACAVNYPSYGGFINTPKKDMPGLIRVSFRLKSLDDIRSLTVVLAKGSIGQPQQVAPNEAARVFKEDGWQVFEYYFVNPVTDPVFVQFNCQYRTADAKGIVIDDIKIESNPNFVSPVSEIASALFTNDGFSVRWVPSKDSDDYLVSLYEERQKGSADFKVEEDFDGWQTDAVGTLPSENDGWKIEKMYPNHPALVDYEGGKALAIGHHNEIVELPSSGGRFKELSFDIVNMKGDNEKAWGSQISIEGWNGNLWTPIRSIGTNGMDDMATARVDLGEWEDEGPGQYEMEIPAFRGLYSKIRIVCESANYGAMMLIDNVRMETSPESETVCLKADEPVSGFEKVFTGMDMDKTYLVGVKVKKGDLVSDELLHEPFGIATPEVKEATDADDSGFTANWNGVSKVSAYLVTVYDCLVAEKDVKDYVLVDESMENVSVGSTDYNKPVKLGNLEEYFDLGDYIGEGWIGAGIAAVDGAIGCRNSSFMPGMYGIQSPEMHLHNNGGKFVVKATVWGRAGSGLSVACNRYIGSTEEFADDGEREVVVEMEGGTKHDRLILFSTDGKPFFIKDIKVMQDVAEGEYMLQTLGMQEALGDKTSAYVAFPSTEVRSRAYDVMAGRQEYTRSVVSDYSETMLVKNGDGVDAAEADPEIMMTVRNSLLILSLFRDAEVYVWSADGCLVASEAYAVGTHEVRLPGAGVYVVKAGGTVNKIMVK